MEQKLRFGPVGNTEKIIWANYEELLGGFFHVFRGKKKTLLFLFKNIVASALLFLSKNIVASALKSCIK